MKRLLAVIFSVVLLFSCGKKPVINEVSYSSGFDNTELTEQDFNNLETLCRVWGFVKYHHPIFCTDSIDVDAELFRLLPKTIGIDKARTNELLYDWVLSFGDFEEEASIDEYMDIFESKDEVKMYDITWLQDTTILSTRLSDYLQKLRYAKRGWNYYSSAASTDRDRTDFSNEKEYVRLKNPDYGFRLLSLFRYWNTIEYFFPNKHLTDTNWNDVLPEYIRRMAHPEHGEYLREVLRLLTETDDSHACSLQNFGLVFGTLRPNIPVYYIENKFVVIYPYYMPKNSENILKNGDVITKVQGIDVNILADSLAHYIPHSNKSRLYFNLSEYLFSTNQTTIDVEIDRNGKLETLTLLTKNRDFRTYPLPQDIMSTYQVVDSVGYINGYYINANLAQNVADTLKQAKGVIIDLRGYPEGGDLYNVFSGTIYNINKPYLKSSFPATKIPGTYVVVPNKDFENRIAPEYFKGKIVLLVNDSTMSAMEYLTMILQSMPNVTVVGSQTAGADGNVTCIMLPGGIETYFSGLGVYYPDGAETQRVGIRIDHYVPYTLNKMLKYQDDQYDKAVEIIKNS